VRITRLPALIGRLIRPRTPDRPFFSQLRREFDSSSPAPLIPKESPGRAAAVVSSGRHHANVGCHWCHSRTCWRLGAAPPGETCLDRVPFWCHCGWCIVDDEQTTHRHDDRSRLGRWRLQVAVDPDPVSGGTRRLSRTVHGTRSEQGRAPAHGRGRGRRPLWSGRVTLGTADQFLAAATLGRPPESRLLSVTERHLKPPSAMSRFWKSFHPAEDYAISSMRA